MPDTVRVELEIEDELDLSLRTWITARLLLERGVHAAVFRHDDPRRLVVEHDAGAFSPLTLADRVSRLGANGEVRVVGGDAPPGGAQEAGPAAGERDRHA